jgi:hypothetical protein
MTALILSIVLFMPNWSADTPTENKTMLSRTSVEQYQSLSECREDLKAVSPILGVYSQIYPDKLGYHVAVSLECAPAEEI